MRPNVVCLRVCFLSLVMSFGAAGGIITLSALDTGWYNSSGYHDPSNTSYLAGWYGYEYRNWAVFDLSGVSGTITGATLKLWNPASPHSGYSSPDPTETYTLFDVSTPVATLMAGGSGLTGVFSDLGSGTVYGSRVVGAADNGTLVSILLNANALAALNAAGGLFAFGGALTTLSGVSNQFIFGYSGGPLTRELELTTSEYVIPEPGSLLLLGSGFAALAALRFRRRG